MCKTISEKPAPANRTFLPRVDPSPSTPLTDPPTPVGPARPPKGRVGQEQTRRRRLGAAFGAKDRGDRRGYRLLRDRLPRPERRRSRAPVSEQPHVLRPEPARAPRRPLLLERGTAG